MSLQSCVDELAETLGRPVGVDDRHLRARAYSSHREQIDSVRVTSILRREAPAAVREWLDELGIRRSERPTRIPPNATLDMVARVCVPLRFQQTLHGYLWLIDEPVPLGDSELEQVSATVDQLAAELYRLRRIDDDERERLRKSALDVLGEDRAAADNAARVLLDGPLDNTGCFAVLVVRPERRAGADENIRREAALEQMRHLLPPRRIITVLRQDEPVGILAAVSPGELETLATVVQRSWNHAVVALGGARSELADLFGSLREAQRAAWVAASLPDHDSVAVWSRLGADGMIAALIDGQRPTEALPAAIARIGVAKDGALLLRTLEAYLEHAGDARETARELYMHRSSVYQHLRRIEEAAEVNLQSGNDRLALHLGLRLRRLADARPEAAPVRLHDTREKGSVTDD
jgi:PucR C-terminal helix-turn-helix domain/GGDEF-like domain